MKWRQFTIDYLRFSKKDRVGVCVLLLVISSGVFIPLLFSRDNSTVIKPDAELLAAVDSLSEKQNYADDESEDEELAFQPQPTARNSFSKGELFVFDPNILSADGWKKLGLNDRNARTILNYRSKGGKFYKADDLKKIWFLPEGFYDYVKNHISIPRQEKKNENFVAKTEKRKSWNIDINHADTSELIALPGIGSKLAARIVSFREKLGGFYSVEQIRETYGLSDTSFQKIKPFLFINGEVEKFNINSATKDDLKNHPYIKWNIANAIVEYRKQHGNYNQLDDLKNITIVDEPTFNKIAHYLSL
jgi:competence protein ComEA